MLLIIIIFIICFPAVCHTCVGYLWLPVCLSPGCSVSCSLSDWPLSPKTSSQDHLPIFHSLLLSILTSTIRSIQLFTQTFSSSTSTCLSYLSLPLQYTHKFRNTLCIQSIFYFYIWLPILHCYQTSISSFLFQYDLSLHVSFRNCSCCTAIQYYTSYTPPPSLPLQ